MARYRRDMLRPALTALAALALALAACGYPYTPPVLTSVSQAAGPAVVQPPLPLPFADAQVPPPAPLPTTASASDAVPLILVSIDGFRADYLDRGITPTLSRLAAGGVRADMRPAFPSKTFPNHWTLVTGLVPDRHGIVANAFNDAARPGERFTMTSEDPFWWNAAEPLWVTAEKAGIPTATMFWPGSSVGWGGTRTSKSDDTVGGTYPRDWWPFGSEVTDAQRVRGVLDWLRRPAAERPRFITLYFEEVDHAGHDFGPDAAQTNAAIAAADQSIGALVSGLAALGQRANLVIVADHGMAATSSERVIPLDQLVPPADATVDESGPYATLIPTAGREAAVAAALLTKHDHMRCWRKENIPARFHYGSNPRIPPFLCLADVGWLINKSAPRDRFTGGNHGYDNQAPEMRALFVASGPGFVGGRRLAPFDNVDVAPLLRDLLGLPAGQRLDGDDQPFRRVLRRD